MNGFRACLRAIVAEDVPEPEGDELTFFRQWLAERNLGLVPVDDAASFSWPGYWIGRIDSDAVLMYGSPSGPVDATQHVGRAVETGWVVAKLDLALGMQLPYGAVAGTGTVTALLVAPDAEAPMARVDSVAAVAGRGLDGDRYGAGRGTFSGNGRGYELTLVSAEALADVGVAPRRHPRRRDDHARRPRRAGLGSHAGTVLRYSSYSAPYVRRSVGSSYPCTNAATATANSTSSTKMATLPNRSACPRIVDPTARYIGLRT
jgi:hypothetical protein